MKKTGKAFLFVAVALLALVAGLALRGGTSNGEGRAVPPSVFTTALPRLEGGTATLAQWKGKVLVVNFWATWCAPCRKEIPDFVQLQSELGAKGLQFVGIAIDEPKAVKDYADGARINYPLLVTEIEGTELLKALGNDMGGLPYTVVFDREGRVARVELGGTNAARLRPVLEGLL